MNRLKIERMVSKDLIRVHLGSILSKSSETSTVRVVNLSLLVTPSAIVPTNFHEARSFFPTPYTLHPTSCLFLKFLVTP